MSYRPEREELQVLEVLSPIFAMAGGKDLISGDYAVMVLSEYTQAISGFHMEVARRGVLKACAGETFKPTVEKVRHACQSVLEDLATAVMNHSAREALAALSDAEELEIANAAPRAQNELRQKAWARHFGISWDSFLAVKFGSILDKVRLLPTWQRIEPSLGKETNRINELVEAMFANGKTLIEDAKKPENEFGSPRGIR